MIDACCCLILTQGDYFKSTCLVNLKVLENLTAVKELNFVQVREMSGENPVSENVS